MSSDADALVDVWRAAVAACDPRRVVREACAALRVPVPSLVVAVGKAAGAMAAGAIDAFGAGAGIVVTVDGVRVPDTVTERGWRVRRAGHPVSDERSEAAGREVMALMQGTRADDVVLFLISGGASALMEVPRDGDELSLLQFAILQEMRRGAPIAAINRARTELSLVKGGKLAAMCPGRIVTLVVSDVPGDDVSVVGSGPTVPGKPSDTVHLIAGLAGFRRAAAEKLSKLTPSPPLGAPAESKGLATGDGVNFDNFRVEEREEVLEGDVEEVASEIGSVARRLGERHLWVAGGEWTVKVGDAAGRGGRATHLALRVARELAGMRGVRVLVAGSDGVDGTGPWAGAVVDGETWGRVGAGEGERGLAECDSGTVLDGIGATITSGPTGVNHADLVIVARDERATQGP